MLPMQCSIEIFLGFKVCFSLVTIKINNQVALHSFNCYLAALQSTLGPYRGSIPTYPMLITAFDTYSTRITRLRSKSRSSFECKNALTRSLKFLWQKCIQNWDQAILRRKQL